MSAVNKVIQSTAIRNLSVRLYSKKKQSSADQSTTSGPAATNADVAGLSKKVVDVPSQPVGPGAAKDKEYKNPEYFCYHVDSFGEAFVEMAKFRLPAPSNTKKFDRNL